VFARVAILLVAVIAASGGPLTPARIAAASTLPAGFQESVVISGLTNPTVVRFASDGRVFVAEKSGIIKVFDNLADPAPDVFADLRTNVHDFWDRGMLGMALDPAFPTNPYVYVLYAYDHILGDAAPPPRWGDRCPSPPGATADGCVVSGRLSRLQATGNQAGPEQPLIEDWCQQYPSHSVGSIAFGGDGALYVSGGDGASFNFADYGQAGGSTGSPTPRNPCGDPPVPVGSTPTAPTAEGGALRSQDLRTGGDPGSRQARTRMSAVSWRTG
jgi:glucose/arabinose dehydrogenase